MREKTVIIIGDSPFLKEVEDKINYVIERYETIGINNAVIKYPVGLHIFQDLKFIYVTNKYPEVKTVSLYTYGDAIQKENKELYDSYVYNFKVNTADDLYKDNKLAWCGFTHDFAISYAIHKGYKDIVLLGAADFYGSTHHSTGSEFNFAEKLKWESKKFIEDICCQRAHIMTCNPNSYLNIPRIPIDDLLI